MKYTIDNYPIKSIQVGDEVVFTPELTYEVATTHLLLRGRAAGRNNASIFRILGMDESAKNRFCQSVYGYRSDGLFNKFTSLEDGVKIVNALYEALSKQKNIKTKLKVEVTEHANYTDYSIGKTRVRLFGNPLTIIKPTVTDGTTELRTVREPEALEWPG